MKRFSPRGKPLSRATAKNAALLNQLATPGLGSLLGRRWIAGGGQLLLSVTGFTLVLVWFGKEMIQYYGQITGEIKPEPIGWILEIGALVFACAWTWSAVTSFSLIREASMAKLRSLENFASPPVQQLEATKIAAWIALTPKWRLLDGKIERTFEFKDFPAAIQFVEVVAALAEQAWHHPDIDIRWNKVTLTLTTHDAGGLTEKDFNLARQFDKL